MVEHENSLLHLKVGSVKVLCSTKINTPVRCFQDVRAWASAIKRSNALQFRGVRRHAKDDCCCCCCSTVTRQRVHSRRGQASRAYSAYSASSASSAALATATMAASHRRAVSRKAADPKPNESAAINLFVKNTRLLNLDLLPDWPAITPASFSTHDARARIRCTEWCLFQLFRIYDSATTLDKLQPFFPPLEPLQSINLRAALYRCLNELKKNGVLGRETVLRKSMLDECQGDKFWDLCLSFSSIVLRKVSVDKHNKKVRPIAEQIATAETLRKSRRESMLPLAIAHRAALTKILTDKERKRQTIARLHNVFLDKEVDLRERKMVVQEQSRIRPPKKHYVVDEVLEKSWVGKDDVRSTLVNGDEVAGTDSVLTTSFDNVWQDNSEDQLFPSRTEDRGMLEELDTRVRNQRRRLQKWQGFQEKLLSSKTNNTKDIEAANKKPELQFDQHQNMTLRDMEDQPPPSSPTKHEKHDSVTKYDEILTAMREELRKKSVIPNLSAPTPEPEATPRARPQSYRKPSVSQEVAPSPGGIHERSNSQTAVPMRPIFGKRMSMRSRSYQQPKVISQREPIPLKTEIFSPLKSGVSPSSSGRLSLLASPVEDESADLQVDDTVAGAAQRLHHDNDLSRESSNSTTPAMEISGTNTPISARSSMGNADSAIDVSSKVSGRVVRPSLADRTRMSMAFKGAEDVGIVPPEVHTSGSSPADTDESPSLQPDLYPSHQTSSLERQPTLHERTRQSISAAPQPSLTPNIAKRASMHQAARPRPTFPVNQFETPQKGQQQGGGLLRPIPMGMNRAASASSLSSSNGNPSPHMDELSSTPYSQQQHRNFTPREKLFEEDAEYSSIFKPRPKVALSPVVSPSSPISDGSAVAGASSGEFDDGMDASPSVRRE